MDAWVIIATLFVYLVVGGVLLLVLSKWDRSLSTDLTVFPKLLDFLDFHGSFIGFLQVALWPIVIGGWLLFRLPVSEESERPQNQAGVELVGRMGVAASTLRPWGKVEVEGQSYQARAQAGYIETGAQVEVVGRESQGLVVRESTT